MPRLFWLFGVVGFGACLHGVPDDLPETKPPKIEPDPIVPPEQPIALADRQPGPLSYDAPIEAAMTHALQLARMRDAGRHLDATELADDMQVARHLVLTFYGEALENETRRPDVATLASALSGSLESRLHMCIWPAGVDMPCTNGRTGRPTPTPAPTNRPPFELADPTPGVVTLTVRDLTGHDSRWSELGAKQLARLRAAHGIVVDLRTARGDDPRPLIPWLEQVTGRAPLRPLREIVRPDDSESVIAAYAARFVTPSRDRAAWDGLVGAMPAAVKHATPTITVLIGPGCDSACELVARVLETYAGATVSGRVLATGRLGHDDPARVVLPHSRLSIYFFATRFVLADEIEKTTGLTDHWAERHNDIEPKNVESFALRDIEQREHGGWPRCDAQPYVRAPQLLPEALKSKFPSANAWNGPCAGGWAIEVYANAPWSALQQLVTSCNLARMQVAYSRENQFNLYFPGLIPFGVLSQIAASPLVERVELRCQERVYLD